MKLVPNLLGRDRHGDLSTASKGENRRLSTRVVLTLVWLIPIYFVAAAITGAIVGVLSDSSGDSVEDAYAAAEAASTAFFERYGFVGVLSAIAIVATLSWYGMLPGTGKYKNISYRKRWESLPSVLRSIISVLVVAIAGGIWGIFAAIAGAPSIITTIGLFVIVAGIGTALHRKSN